jgi:hypothetical protein
MAGSEFRAGVEVYGRIMRYAEVQGGGGDPLQLVRLGACDFDFDVAETLLGLAGTTHLDTVATAIREIFEGSEADSLAVVVHPWNSTSFFSPLPAGMAPSERFEQLRQEAAMLSDASVARPVRVKATPVRIERLRDGREAHWHHVLRLSDSVHARIDHIAERPGDGEATARPHDFVDSTAAAAAVVARRVEGDDGALSLALGVYGDRAEYALCRGAAWQFGHYSETGALEDGPYFVAALLDRLGVAPSAVETLYLYGDRARAERIEGIAGLLGRPARALNPLDIFGPLRSGADPFTLASYTPVIGSLLKRG